MIAKEMEKILPFDCQYEDGVENTQKAPDYTTKLRATMASVTKREKHPFMYTDPVSQSRCIFRYYTFLILSESHFHFKLVYFLAVSSQTCHTDKEHPVTTLYH